MFHGIKAYILLLLQAFILDHSVGLAISHQHRLNRRFQPCKFGEKCKSLGQCPHLYAAYNSGVEANNIISNSRRCGNPTKIGQSYLFCCPKPKNFLPKNECGSRGNRTKGREAGLNEFPWMAMLLYWNSSTNRMEPKCGGSLINNWYVLTTAHCVRDPGNPDIGAPERVRLGDHNTATTSFAPYVEIDVAGNIMHEEFFHGSAYRNDIALLLLKIPVIYSPAIKPICLPDLSTRTPFHNQTFEAAGWGNNSPVLLRSFIKELHPFDPRCKAPIFKFKTQICAKGDGYGNEVAGGDSGGPLMTTTKRGREDVIYLAGIISYAYESDKNMASFYTKTLMYIDWITENL